MRKLFLVLLTLCCSLNSLAQDNVLLSRDYWKKKPTLAQVKAAVAQGNDATTLNRNAFDATVWALLEKANTDVITYLLSLEGNDIEKRTHDSRTYIFWAAYSGNTAVMQYLLEKGAKVNDVRDSHGNTPVTFAAATGQKNPEVYILFEKYGAVLTEHLNEDGVNSMFLLAPYLESEKELAFFENKGFDISAKDPKGNTLFVHAAKGGNVRFLKLLISKGLNPTIINKEGGNAILYASMGKRGSKYSLDTFTYLESLGIDPNVVGDYGRNPLHRLAYVSKDVQLINYFIKKGVDPNLQDKGGDSPFMNAANSNSLGIVQLLSTHLKDINAQDENGRSALAMAVNRNSVDVVKFLIEKGADTSVRDTEGNTLAYYVLNTFDKNDPKEFEEKLSFLQKNKVTINATQNNGNSLLHIAAERNNLELLKRLESLNIDINAKNNEGYTALHIAAMKAKDDTILRYLLAQGADNAITTGFEESAYDLASENELLEKNNIAIQFLK